MDPVTDVRVTQNFAVPSISLVSEIEESVNEPTSVGVGVPPAEIPEETLAAESVLPAARCVGVGPFTEFGRFVQALARLRSAGYSFWRNAGDHPSALSDPFDRCSAAATGRCNACASPC